MKATVCGLGRMGTAFASTLLAAGYDLTVWNRTPRSLDGARTAESLAEAADSADVIVIAVFDGRAAQDVLLGADGIVSHAAPGTLIINTTTLSPGEARHLASDTTAAGLRYVDAPVVGSVPAVRTGSLVALAGGSAEDAEAAKAILDLWSHAGGFWHTGEAGTATALKLVANLALGTALAGVHDAIRLSAELGVARDDALSLLKRTPLGGLVTAKQDRLVHDSYDNADFSIDALLKDLALACGESSQPLHAAQAATRIAGAVASEGAGDQDISALGRSVNRDL